MEKIKQQNNDKSNGYDSGLNKNTPFVDKLINKRSNYCVLGPSSHIAVFIPTSYSSRSCLIHKWEGKCRNG